MSKAFKSSDYYDEGDGITAYPTLAGQGCDKLSNPIRMR